MITYLHFDPVWVTSMVTKCYTAFKIVSFGIMVRFIELDALFCLGLRIWVYTCNTRAMIISNEVQIPFHFMHFRISSVTDIIRLRTIIIKQ